MTNLGTLSGICEVCGENVKSVYATSYKGVWYCGHKRCMGVPMLSMLTETFVAHPPPIALCGRMRSGKDSVADYLTQKYGYTRFAFGDGIRRVTRELYPQLYEGGAKPRALLQGFGQDARKYNEDVWVDDCFRRIEYARYEDGANFNVVISDLRQPNEIKRCREDGYVIVRVNCTDTLRIERAKALGDTFTRAELTHETESHVDTFSVDYDVYNVGTLADLYAQVDAIIAVYPGRHSLRV
jgi:dephospho-CoA kinase